MNTHYIYYGNALKLTKELLVDKYGELDTNLKLCIKDYLDNMILRILKNEKYQNEVLKKDFASYVQLSTETSNFILEEESMKNLQNKMAYDLFLKLDKEYKSLIRKIKFIERIYEEKKSYAIEYRKVNFYNKYVSKYNFNYNVLNIYTKLYEFYKIDCNLEDKKALEKAFFLLNKFASDDFNKIFFSTSIPFKEFCMIFDGNNLGLDYSKLPEIFQKVKENENKYIKIEI